MKVSLNIEQNNSIVFIGWLDRQGGGGTRKTVTSARCVLGNFFWKLAKSWFLCNFISYDCKSFHINEQNNSKTGSSYENLMKVWNNQTKKMWQKKSIFAQPVIFSVSYQRWRWRIYLIDCQSPRTIQFVFKLILLCFEYKNIHRLQSSVKKLSVLKSRNWSLL